MTSRNAAVFSIAGFLLAVFAMAQASPSDDRATDRKEIATLVKGWEEAWNAHDMNAFGKLFHEEGTWILWTGAVWTGRTAIVEGHAAVHRTFFRNSVQRERLEELTFVAPMRRS